MFGLFLAAWRRFPEARQRSMVQERIAHVLAAYGEDVALLRRLLPDDARKPFDDLITALRKWTKHNGRSAAA